MPALTIQCDSCGVETNVFEADYDGIYRCLPCDLNCKIKELEQQLRSKEEWIKPFLNEIEQMRIMLDKLKK